MRRAPSTSLARQVASQGAAILVLTLALVGLGTGLRLHALQVEALDALLLEAARGSAHPPVRGGWEVEHDGSAVETWLVEAGDPRVPAALLAAASGRDTALVADVGSQRLVLLAVEGGGGHGDRDDEREGARPDAGEDDDHAEREAGRHDEGHASRLLVAATAPRVRPAASVGAFAATYALLALLAAVGAGLAQRWLVRRALHPLERTQREAAAVVALGQGQRLSGGGPTEIRALLLTFNALLDRLDTAYAAQGRFTAESAHELRTPVTAMLGELEVALRHPRSAEEYRQVLASTHEEVQRLARLVSGLTALARLDAGQAEAAREPVRAEELARAALATEQRTLRAAGCAVEVRVDADPELVGHRALLEVGLANLLRNAAAHAPGRAVRLWVAVDGELVRFDVDDAGAGVAEEEREALFDRFVRAGSARTRDRAGLGLGLPIAREVARRHGGDCVLGSSDLGGLRATMTVRLGPELPGGRTSPA